jgi:hypothetical protein
MTPITKPDDTIFGCSNTGCSLHRLAAKVLAEEKEYKDGGMTRKRDPRTDKSATLQDFVRRVNRMGFPQAQRVEYPIWTREDIKWAAVETEKLFRRLQELGWGEPDLDPVARVIHARMAVISQAHAMSHKTSNLKARKIVKNLPRIAE